MRLGDLDALRRNLRNHALGFPSIIAEVDAAPTICCAECEHRKRPEMYGEPVDDWMCAVIDNGVLMTSDDFGCSDFQRRQP